MNLYSKFPEREKLLKWYAVSGDGQPRLVNAHLHTPHSFSAFIDIPQALDMALNQNVRVAGINDFYTTNGYAEWAEGCSKRGLFPLFNIEYISLNSAAQLAGIKINDPANPGRTYLSGKGLAFPPKMSEANVLALESVKIESNSQVARMCEQLNAILKKCEVGFVVDFENIKTELTLGMVRERHLAKALRQKVFSNFKSIESQIEVLEKIFGGKSLKSNIANVAALENEIRANLLKAGGAAFIPESSDAFLESEKVIEIILDGGGIPTYPFLADDANGNFTDFEADKEQCYKKLVEKNIWSVEFITTRNSIEVLEDYALYFYQKGFVVTFGSEHNTPEMEPIELFARNKTPLSPLLIDINYQGASVLAAHQYLFATTGAGYIDSDGKPDIENREKYVVLGEALIEFIAFRTK